MCFSVVINESLMLVEHNKAVQIVRFDDETDQPIIDVAAAERVIKRRGTEKLRTILVSIGGAARSGKSFLLNLFVHYLKYLKRVRSGIFHIEFFSVFKRF